MGGPGSCPTPEMEECDSISGRCHHHLVFSETVPPPLLVRAGDRAEISDSWGQGWCAGGLRHSSTMEPAPNPSPETSSGAAGWSLCHCQPLEYACGICLALVRHVPCGHQQLSHPQLLLHPRVHHSGSCLAHSWC